METIIYFSAVTILAFTAYFARSKRSQAIFATIFSLIQAAFAVYISMNVGIDKGGYFKADYLSAIFVSLLSITTITSIINSFVYLNRRHEKLQYRAYYFSTLYTFIGCITGVLISNNIGLMWILMEATTLCIAILIYHEKIIESLEATWKYVFVSTIGLSFTLIGILLLDVATSGISFHDFTFSALMQSGIDIQNKLLFQVSFLLIVIGLSVKMEMFPLHTVCVDAVSVAPSPVSALITTSLMNAGFVCFYRFYLLFMNSPLHSWINHVLMIMGFMSILIAAAYMIKVKNYKRLVAYSSIEHIGIVALGISFGGLASFAAILHLIIHTFTKAGLFYQVGQFIRIYKTSRIYGTGGYFRITPSGGLIVLAAFFTISGFPPSGLFFTEFMIFSKMIQSGNIGLAITIMILLCFILWVFSRNFLKILFHAVPEHIAENHEKIRFSENIPQLVLIIMALYVSINPPEALINAIWMATKGTI